MQNQAANNQVGSTLLGAGLGAALGAAVGGGRGAAIGAASGAVVGTGAGAANAANADAYAQQTYSNTYWSCMSSYGYGPRYWPNTSSRPADPRLGEGGHARVTGGGGLQDADRQGRAGRLAEPHAEIEQRRLADPL